MLAQEVWREFHRLCVTAADWSVPGSGSAGYCRSRVVPPASYWPIVVPAAAATVVPTVAAGAEAAAAVLPVH